MTKEIHFHRTDDRFCGSVDQMRQFSTDPNTVTCQHCKDRDGFGLSGQARDFLRESYPSEGW